MSTILYFALIGTVTAYLNNELEGTTKEKILNVVSWPTKLVEFLYELKDK